MVREDMSRSVLGLCLVLVSCETELRPDCPSFEAPDECNTQQGCSSFALVNGENAEGTCYHLCAPCGQLCPADPETCPDGLVCVESGILSSGPEQILGVVGLCLPAGSTSNE